MVSPERLEPERGFLLFNEEGPRRSALFTYVPDPTGFPLFIKEEDLQVRG